MLLDVLFILFNVGLAVGNPGVECSDLVLKKLDLVLQTLICSVLRSEEVLGLHLIQLLMTYGGKSLCVLKSYNSVNFRNYLNQHVLHFARL